MKKNNSPLSQMGQRTEAPSISWLMEVALARPNLISLAAGFTDNPSLPVSSVRELLEDLLASPQAGQAALQYGTTMGDPELRQLTASQLCRQDIGKAPAKLPPEYAPERMIITNGSQQMLYMVTEAMCDPGDIVLVEDPTYFVYLGITQSHGLRCRGIRLMNDGIDLEHLEAVLNELKKSGDLRRVKMLYLVTYFQNPSGVTTCFAKKAAALKLLKKYERDAGHPIYLLEDAAYRDLRFGGEDIPTALTLPGAASRVIYAGTYSKPFATGLRVGFGILPEPLLTVVSRIKGNHDFGTANLLQQALKRAIIKGHYDKHLVALRQRYHCKAQIMTRAIEHYFPPEVRWEKPTGGLYVWPDLPVPAGKQSRLFKTALDQGVLYVPGELCFADDAARPKPLNQMRLSFGGALEKNIETGIERLGKAIASFLKKPASGSRKAARK